MAQMDTSGGDSGHKKGPGVKKAKKLSTRVDMTPMVDLGFLLITFFIYTTTMSTPNTTKLNMPKKEEDQTQVQEVVKSGLLTILLGKSDAKNPANDQIYYYDGELDPAGANFMTSNYSNEATGIRKVIQKKKAQVIAAHQHTESCKKLWAKNDENKTGALPDQEFCKTRDLVVIVKPSPEAKYGRTVDLLDEMQINKIPTYAIIDIAESEKTILGLAAQKNQ